MRARLVAEEEEAVDEVGDPHPQLEERKLAREELLEVLLGDRPEEQGGAEYAGVQAVDELEYEGGVIARHGRYIANRDVLISEFDRVGLEPLLEEELRSPIITSFLYPGYSGWDFGRFYDELKSRGFVLYPGKISDAETFRVGSIGHVFPEDFRALGAAARETLVGMGLGGLAAR